jgi:signal transduction histidine kinase
MFETSDQQRIEIRVLHKLVEALASAQTTEQVFAYGLNAINDIFDPDHAFVLLAERGLGVLPAPTRPECIPICLGDELLGKFMLQYDHRRGFTERDLLIAELISAQVSLAIQCVREKNQLKEAIREKDELVTMALREIRSPLAAIIGGVFLLRGGRAPEVEHAIEMIDRNARSQFRLMEDLLNLCQLDAKEDEASAREPGRCCLIQEVIKNIQPQILPGRRHCGQKCQTS